MAELTTVARPYAEAVFSLASDEGNLEKWSETLTWLAAMVKDSKLAEYVSNPIHTAEEVEALLLNILGTHATDQAKYLIAVLLNNRRLMLLPEISELFHTRKAQAEGNLDAVVETAFAMTDEQKAELTETLSKKYAKIVVLDVRENPDLIGGVRISVGDEVIDASVRGKLQAMAASLKN